MQKYFYSVCAVVLDEGLYLAEWIEFNRLEGAEHFYIYDNGSTDNTHEILRKYEKEGIVTWKVFPAKPVQFVAYNDCLSLYGSESQWIAFLDTDEFLYGFNTTISSYIKIFNDKVGAIGARWWLYGSNEDTHSLKLVTERFLRKASTPDKHVKSIVRPHAALSVGRNPHVFYLKDGYVPVDELGKELPIEYAVMEGEEAKQICIAHFHTKSYGEYIRRKKRPDPGTNITRSREDTITAFKAHDRNEIFDASAAKHVNEIMKRLYNK